jgi:hypothetical protein
MKAQYLKISGHKNEKDFYKEFPTIETFMAKHGAALKKAQGGNSAQVDRNGNGVPDYLEYNLYPQQNNQPQNYQMYPQAASQQAPQISSSAQTMQDTTGLVQNLGQSYMQNSGNGFGNTMKGMFSGGDSGKSFSELGKSFGFGGGGATGATGAASSAGGAAGGAGKGISGMMGGGGKGGGGGMGNMGGYVEAAISIGEGFAAMKGEKKMKRKARRDNDVVGVVKDAYDSEDVNKTQDYLDSASRTRKALMPVQYTDAYAKHGGEITNTYAPNTLYTDLETAQYGNNMGYNNSNVMWNNLGTGMQNIAQDQRLAGMSNNFAQSQNIKKFDNAGSKVGSGIGQAIGTYFGGPLGGMVGKFAGKYVGGALDPNYRKIKNFNEQKQQKIDYMMNSNNIQSARMNVAGAYTKNGGTLSSGGNSVGDIHALSGGYLEPISLNPYSGSPISMIKGQSHEESNGRHSGVLLNYGGGKAAHGSMGAPDVEAEDGEPITEIDNNAVIFGDMKINRLTVGDDPMFKNFYGKTFKKAAEGIAKSNEKLGKERDKITYEAEAYDPRTAIDKLKGNSLLARSTALDLKYAVNDAAIRKLAANQEVVHDVTEPVGLNSGKFSRNILEREDTDVAQGGKKVKKSPVVKAPLIPFTDTLQSKPMTIENFNVPTAGPINVQHPYDAPDDPSDNVSQNSGVGLDTLMAMVAPWLRDSSVEGLSTDQISPELNALADNDVEPVQARFYHPQLRDPNSQVSFQDQMNANQADFNQLSRIAADNPEALSALAAQKYGANSKILAEQFRVNQGQREQVNAQNQATLNDALMKNLQIADQQYVRQATAKSATKAVRQEALSSIASKVAQNRLENRTLQTYANMFPDYSFDSNYRIQKTGAPALFNTQLNSTPASAAARKATTKTVPVYEEDGKTIKEYKTIRENRNGGLVKAFRDL